jgi:Fur family ferric uptake transcriptional regulator
VIEFVDPEIEALQERIAAKLGYRLMGHRLELYGLPVKKRLN